MGGKKTAAPPTWTPLFVMAKELGIAPWVIEKECPPEWYLRWQAYKTAESAEIERREKKRGK